MAHATKKETDAINKKQDLPIAEKCGCKLSVTFHKDKTKGYSYDGN